MIGLAFDMKHYHIDGTKIIEMGGRQMDTSRFLAVSGILEHDLASGYIKHLDDLVRLYSQAQANPSQDFYKQIEAERAELFHTLEGSPVNNLVPSRKAILVALGVDELFGARAAAAIQGLMTQSAPSGPAAILGQLETFKERVLNAQKLLAQVAEGLSTLGVTSAEVGPDEYEVGISIPSQVTKDQLGELIDVLEDWNFIVRTFLELGGEKTPEVELRGTSTGSLDFFASIPIEWAATALVLTVERLVKLYSNILQIQVHRRSLKELGAPALETTAVEEHEQKTIRDTIDALASEILGRLPKEVDKPRLNELKTHLAKSLQMMALYLDEGVDMEVSFPPPESIPKPKPTGDDDRDHELAVQYQAQIDGRKDSMERGAAVSQLPKREHRVFQLPKPQRPASEGQSKDPTRSKKPTDREGQKKTP